MRLGQRVTALSQIGDEFEVHTSAEVLHARQVVVATGPFQVPFIPQIAWGFDTAVTQIHSADYRNPESIPPGSALVVGAGNSGLQIAGELAATRQVEVSVGEKVPMIPQRLLGRDLFWWLNGVGFMRINTTTRLGRRLEARGEFVIGSNRRRLMRAGVRFRPRLVSTQGRTARFADGSTLDASVVVWATGYRSDYSWIAIPGVDGRRPPTAPAWGHGRARAVLPRSALAVHPRFGTARIRRRRRRVPRRSDRHPGRGRPIDPSGPCRTTDSSDVNRQGGKRHG